MAYGQARKDFEYLESVEELNDQVTLMDELQNFMRNPTKAFAQDLYEQGISLWFGENRSYRELKNRRVNAIAERYGED